MSTRRQFIQQVSAVAGLGAALSVGLGLTPTRVQAASGGAGWMPDEGDRHRRAFVAFGAQPAIWADFTADVQAAIGLIARTIARYEPVTVLCRERERQLAEQLCGTRNTRFIHTELDDIWMRDIGANFVGASLMVSQELLWNEQRISLKVMPSYVNYSDPELQQRSNQLFGSNYLQRFIKDYNAINVWVSVNPASFNPKQHRLKWLNVAVGYGAGGMFGGYDNQWTDASGNFHNRDDIQRYRKLLVSLDIDLSRVPTRSRYMRLLLDALNIIKVPAPTLEWNSKGEILFHPLM